jgi:hypothetical protein
MKDKEDAVFDALIRAKPFLDENAALFTGADLTAARKRLDDVIASFSANAVDQNVGIRGAKGETAKQQQLRLKLRTEQMKPIATIARHNLRAVPEFKALQMPSKSVRGQAFIASAKGMSEAATIHKDTLVGHGLPPTFLDDLNTGIANLVTSQSDREKSRTLRIGATKALSLEEKNGQTVLSVLDALVQQALGGSNDALLRKWQSVRLVRRRTANVNTPATMPTSGGTTAPAPTGAAPQSTTSAAASTAAMTVAASDSTPAPAAP